VEKITGQFPSFSVYLTLEADMGYFYEKITLENVRDRANADDGYIREDQVRSLELNALPDTGAWRLVINEEIRQQLGLKTTSTRTAILADGSNTQFNLTEAVKLCWKDRHAIMEAMILPSAKTVLLGVLSLEALDLCVDPVNQKLVGVHGDSPLELYVSVR
jgi:clan AA aspartic protease